MKKILVCMGIYTTLVFILCTGVSFFQSVPVLLEGAAAGYRFLRGTEYFLSLLPVIFISGITFACSIQWQKGTADSAVRFSHGMTVRFKNILIVSLFIVFILMLNTEIFIPSVKAQIVQKENAPVELEESLATSKIMLQKGRPLLALQYAQKACDIAPDDIYANRQLHLAQNSADLARDRELHEQSCVKPQQVSEKAKVSAAGIFNEKGYSVKELIEKSKTAAASGDWFNAHYWAQIAVQCCEGTETNRTEAISAANDAWNKLNEPKAFGSEKERAYYEKKYEGYKLLLSRDFLKSYYIFLSLESSSQTIEADPDVEEFLSLAKKGVESMYFFFDETDGMIRMENTHNIYFALSNSDGTKTVFYIKGAMDVKGNGGSVRYLESLDVVNYGRNGVFRYAFHAPYAKVIEQNTADFSANARTLMGLAKEWKSVPFVQLCSVSRTGEGIITSPEFTFKETGIPNKIVSELGFSKAGNDAGTETDIKSEFIPFTSIILPMPYSDFAVISEASSGAQQMPLYFLAGFVKKAVHYGFSAEVFSEILVTRAMYPLFMLIICIMCAVAGWNYRISDKSALFKFSWLIIIPLYGFLMFIILNSCYYLFGMLNYLIVGIFGMGALAAATVFYTILFALASLNFLSRKN